MTAKLKRGGPGFARVIAAFFIGGFAIFELLYCVQPLLPEFAREFRLAPASASLAVSVSTVVMASTLFFAGFAAARFGRKPVMVASLVVSALATLGCALAPNWGALLALRGLMGLALAGLPSLAMAYLAEEIDGPALGFAMGMYIAGSTLGGMFGRLVVGFIADHGGWRLALAAIGLNSLVGAVFFALALPGERAGERRPASFASLIAHARAHFGDEGLPWLFAVGYLVMGAFICTYNYIGFRLAAPPFSLDQTRIGLIFTLYLLGAVSSTIMGDLAARLGRRRVLWIALAIGLVGVLVSLPDRLLPAVLGVALVTWSFFGAHSIASSWVGLRANEGRAQASALYLFFYYVGSSLNGWMGGLAYQRDGWDGVAALIVALLGLAFLAALKLARVAAAAPSAERPDGMARRRRRHRPEAARRKLRRAGGDDARARPPPRPRARRALAAASAGAAARQQRRPGLARAARRASRRLRRGAADAARRPLPAERDGARRAGADRRAAAAVAGARSAREPVRGAAARRRGPRRRGQAPAALARFEALILEDCGFALDLSTCAATGGETI